MIRYVGYPYAKAGEVNDRELTRVFIEQGIEPLHMKDYSIFKAICEMKPDLIELVNPYIQWKFQEQN